MLLKKMMYLKKKSISMKFKMGSICDYKQLLKCSY